MGSLLPIGIIVLLAWAYDFVNGMNDCANAIATTVSTRALSPRQAIFLAFAFNVLGAFISTEVAKTIGKGILNPEIIDYPIIVSSLVGAIIWAGFCTHYGIPISITHSLVGGLIGAGIAAKGIWALEAAGIKKVLIAMVVSNGGKPGKPVALKSKNTWTPSEAGLLMLKVNAPAGHKCTGRLTVKLSGLVRAE